MYQGSKLKKDDTKRTREWGEKRGEKKKEEKDTGSERKSFFAYRPGGDVHRRYPTPSRICLFRCGRHRTRKKKKKQKTRSAVLSSHFHARSMHPRVRACVREYAEPKTPIRPRNRSIPFAISAKKNTGKKRHDVTTTRYHSAGQTQAKRTRSAASAA